MAQIPADRSPLGYAIVESIGTPTTAPCLALLRRFVPRSGTAASTAVAASVPGPTAAVRSGVRGVAGHTALLTRQARVPRRQVTAAAVLGEPPVAVMMPSHARAPVPRQHHPPAVPMAPTVPSALKADLHAAYLALHGDALQLRPQARHGMWYLLRGRRASGKGARSIARAMLA